MKCFALRSLTTIVLTSALFAAPLSAAPLLGLGGASAFNTFVLGDMQGIHSDVEGRLAVGGNLDLQDYAVAMLLDDSADHTDTLVVGGDVRFDRGRVYHGNLAYGGTAELNEVGFYAGERPEEAAGAAVKKPDALDFVATGAELKQLSAQFGSYQSNGEAVWSPYGGELKLVGNDPLLNVFTLDIGTLSNLRLDLLVPTGAWTLVNFTNSQVSLNSFGMHFGVGSERLDDNVRHDGERSGRVLFNFAQASALDIHAMALPASVLAPLADINFYNARVDGQLVAGNLYGSPFGGEACLQDHTVCSGQSNWYPFLTLNQVPLPGTLILLIPALVLLWCLRVRPGAFQRLPMLTA